MSNYKSIRELIQTGDAPLFAVCQLHVAALVPSARLMTLLSNRNRRNRRHAFSAPESVVGDGQPGGGQSFPCSFAVWRGAPATLLSEGFWPLAWCRNMHSSSGHWPHSTFSWPLPRSGFFVAIRWVETRLATRHSGSDRSREMARTAWPCEATPPPNGSAGLALCASS